MTRASAKNTAEATSDFYELTHSPDDEERTGKGWYASRINSDGSIHETSDLVPTAQHARAWARERGGRRELRGD